MERGQVVKILDFYKTIEKNIRFNKRILSDLEEVYNPIQSSGIKDNNLHSSSSPTEKVALEISDDVSNRIKNIKDENMKLATLKAEVLKEISCLNYNHKVIIFEFYLNNVKWVQISKQLNYSVRQCKNIRDGAIEILKDKFERNKVINTFDVPA